MTLGWTRLTLHALPRDPISIITGVVGLAGSAISAAGAMQQGQAAQRAAEYNAQVAERNAKIAQDKALVEENAIRAKSQRQVGSAAAAIGASGIASEGTPLDVLAETASMGELDALTARWNGKVQQANYQDEATLERMKGKSAAQAARYGAASALIGGVYSVASGFQKSGTSLKLS